MKPKKYPILLAIPAFAFLLLLPAAAQQTDTSDMKKSGFAPVNGINMYYEIHGTGGMPLVLIHGGGSTIETTFGNVLPDFAKYGEVIALELQAHGRTSDRDAPESFTQDADDVAALLAYLKITKADFFGFSNGGNTAMQIAIRHPKLVNKLVLASAFYKREGMVPGFFEGLAKATLTDMPAPLKEGFLKEMPDTNRLQAMFDKDRLRMLHFTDWDDKVLRSIKAPTLLIVGDHDVVTPEHTVKMFHLIPRAELMILPGLHGTYLGEISTVKKGSKIPQLTVGVVEEFLRE